MQTIILFFMRLLVVAFFVGLAGSAVVVVVSFIEDFGELLHREGDEPGLPSTRSSSGHTATRK